MADRGVREIARLLELFGQDRFLVQPRRNEAPLPPGWKFRLLEGVTNEERATLFADGWVFGDGWWRIVDRTPSERERVYILDATSQVGNSALFWRPDGAGYCCNLTEAGVYQPGYTRRGTDVEIPESIAWRYSETHVRIEGLCRDPVVGEAVLKAVRSHRHALAEPTCEPEQDECRPDDDHDRARYEADAAKDCDCTHGPCGGVLQGGFCDRLIFDESSDAEWCDDYRDEDEVDV